MTIQSQIRFSVFQYDIPDHVAFPNPCPYLRRRNRDGKVFAFKTQYSMWLVDRDNPPLVLQNRMEQAGCTVDLYPLDACDNDRYLQRAATQMRNELLKQLKREEKSLAAYDAKLADAEAEHASGVIGWDKLHAARRQHARDRQAALGRTEKLVEDLEAAVGQFSIPADTNMFQAVRGRADGLRAAASIRAEMYAQLAQQLGGTPIGNLATESEVPAEILMDYAEDRGIDTTQMREMFREEQAQPRPAPTQVTPYPDRPVQEREPRTYRAQNQVVTTRLTILEAADILRNEQRDAFTNKLVRMATDLQTMTSRQEAWLFILAERARANRRGNQPAPAPTTAPTAVAPQTTTPTEAPTPAPTPVPEATQVETWTDTAVAVEDAPQTPTGAISTARMIYNAQQRMMIAEASTLQMAGFPPTIQVTNHQKGTTAGFIRVAENFDPASEDGVPVSWDYEGPNGITLRILND
jgi:hypothetical protein